MAASAENPSSHTSRSSRKLFRFGLLAVICLGIGWAIWSRLQPQPDPRATELLRAKNLGVGYLENLQLKESLPLLRELSTAYPNELVGTRNLAIAELLRLQQLLNEPNPSPQSQAEATAAAEQAIQNLVAVEPNLALVHRLRARVLKATDDRAGAVAELKQAVEIHPDDPSLWYELFQVAEFAPSEDLQQAAYDALGKAYQYAPDNLKVIREWLVKQSQREDPRIIDTLRESRSVLTPLTDDIATLTHGLVDLPQALDQAEAAVKAGQWPRARGLIGQVMNVLNGMVITKSDMRRIDLHPLEFAVTDFSPEFYQKNQLSRSSAPPAIDVQWLPKHLSLSQDQKISHAQLLDVDLDQALELVLLSQSRFAVFEETKKDQQTSWTESLSISMPGRFQQFLFADLDDDVDSQLPVDNVEESQSRTYHQADGEFLVFGQSGLRLIENRRSEQQRQLVDVTPDDWKSITDVRAAAFIDYEHDGDLDIVIADKSSLKFFVNVGDLQFKREEQLAQELPAIDSVVALIPVDWDRDLDTDLMVISEEKQLTGYLENVLLGRFRWVPLHEMATPESNNAIANRGSDFGFVFDADGNGSWDLLRGSPQHGVRLLRTRFVDKGRAVPIADEVVIPPEQLNKMETISQPVLMDYDNDGYSDVVFSSAGNAFVFRNQGSGEFQLQEVPLNPTKVTQSVEINPDGMITTGDIDQDGDLDLLRPLADRGLQILDNQGGNRNGWIRFQLVGAQIKGQTATESARVNHFAYGSLIELKSGMNYQAKTVSEPVTHFGLGPDAPADVARIIWTNGIPQNVIQPKKNQTSYELQTLLGSCPYLYGWDGEKFVFITDLLWAAPIGLTTPEGSLAPTRPWEYLRIPGELCQPRNGKYTLQITEELWEAAYFDHVSLTAVDHPVGTQIFTNEKVGPPTLAEPQLHSVSRLQVPHRLRDSEGRDVRETLHAADDNYLQAFTRRHCQGYVDEHYIEIDLGDVSEASSIRLVLTGWFRPTDTSINVQLQQNLKLPGPRPPYLLAPDENGRWREVMPFMGFPGGKTKTIVVDVTDVFPTNDYRLRIATSCEIYWDQIAFTLDEEPPRTRSEFRVQTLLLISADLHHRGVSARIEHSRNGPERYDYQTLHPSRWQPMDGLFTRFGDVTELISNADDRMVVMGSGDEMTVHFREPSPSPPGWTRTFVLHCVGWDKDANLSTVLGTATHPLPFRGMRRYPYEPEQNFPDTEAHRNWYRKHQTRRMSAQNFWNRLRILPADQVREN